MALVDAFGASRADEDVLVVVGHPDHFVGDHLADRQDQVVAAFGNHAVHLRGPREIQLTFRLLADEFGRHLAQRDQSAAPVMDAEQALRHIAEHGPDLAVGHGDVGPESGHHVGEPVAVILPGVAGELAGARVEAGEIRGKAQHLAARSQCVEGLEKTLLEIDVGRL